MSGRPSGRRGRGAGALQLRRPQRPAPWAREGGAAGRLSSPSPRGAGALVWLEGGSGAGACCRRPSDPPSTLLLGAGTGRGFVLSLCYVSAALRRAGRRLDKAAALALPAGEGPGAASGAAAQPGCSAVAGDGRGEANGRAGGPCAGRGGERRRVARLRIGRPTDAAVELARCFGPCRRRRWADPPPPC